MLRNYRSEAIRQFFFWYVRSGVSEGFSHNNQEEKRRHFDSCNY